MMQAQSRRLGALPSSRPPAQYIKGRGTSAPRAVGAPAPLKGPRVVGAYAPLCKGQLRPWLFCSNTERTVIQTGPRGPGR